MKETKKFYWQLYLLILLQREYRCVPYILYFVCKQFSKVTARISILMSIFGAFAKLQKSTVSSVMPVRLSFLPHGTTPLRLKGFSLNFTCWSLSLTSVEKIRFLFKADNIKYYRWQYMYVYDDTSLNYS